METFGGVRTYYACLADSATLEEWLAELRTPFPGCDLTGDVDRDRAWEFYRRYRAEYNW